MQISICLLIAELILVVLRTQLLNLLLLKLVLFRFSCLFLSSSTVLQVWKILASIVLYGNLNIRIRYFLCVIWSLLATKICWIMLALLMVYFKLVKCYGSSILHHFTKCLWLLLVRSNRRYISLYQLLLSLNQA